MHVYFTYIHMSIFIEMYTACSSGTYACTDICMYRLHISCVVFFIWLLLFHIDVNMLNMTEIHMFVSHLPLNHMMLICLLLWLGFMIKCTLSIPMLSDSLNLRNICNHSKPTQSTRLSSSTHMFHTKPTERCTDCSSGYICGSSTHVWLDT